MKKQFVSLATLLAVSLFQPLTAQAATGSLTSTVTKVLVSSNTGGGCMATLGNAINTANVNCPGNMVSFSCTGTYASKDLAFYMLDQAQLALALNKQVFVTVDDTKKHNTYCFANRIDVIK